MDFERVPHGRGEFDKWEIFHFPVGGYARVENDVGPRGDEGNEELIEVNAEVTMWIPRVVTDTVTMCAYLVGVDQGAMKVIPKPKDLVGNEDDRFTTCRTGVRCGTACNGDILLRLVIR